MPRGFLVKRTKRSGSSYRSRPAEPLFPPPGPRAAPPCPEEPGRGLSGSPCFEPALDGAEWGAGGGDGPGPSPARPAGSELRRAFLERCLRSPVSAESFPSATAFCSAAPAAATSGEQLEPPRVAVPSSVPAPAPVAAPHSLQRRGKGALGCTSAPAAVRKPKAVRRLSFADEVTTSPVLGLKIKEEEPGAPERALGGVRTPLGEFICQLCKQQYADPFALAQHRCSRIVRVEYRCPECDKVFSCPANLASHRRWHKPRPTPSCAASKPPSAPLTPPDPSLAAGKENGRMPRTGDQHPQVRDSSGDGQHRDSAARPGLQALVHPEVARPQAPYPEVMLGRRGLGPGGASPGATSEVFVCPYCHKKFRRQAYLRKHLGTHEAGPARAPAPSFGSERTAPLAFACPLCGAHFPSADIREKHRLWHAVREELLLPALVGAPSEAGPGGGSDGSTQQIFSCKYCPSTFFSSPGLTRHINKCHPSESRQVLLLQMPLRPGC
ncbi:insulinoma-associated protein 2 [Arvicola amphibius]|uniref:insulinoma-associated protein 2 n=1 Tax=Arvicola amphibius TaxID=1047088 RepID=UPI0018E2F6C2|nr:insulinoma-associated protein 2 [Arvicola amphibius]